MNKKQLSKKIILVIALIAILMVSIPGTFSFIVAKTNTLVNTFIPFKGLIGDVIINKQVEHPYGDDYKIPEDISFEYEVDLGSFYAGYDVETTDGVITADENGVIRVTVYPGKPFGLRNIDENMEVTITEIGMGPGFSVKGDAVQTVTVSGNTPVQVDYINSYRPEEAPLVYDGDSAGVLDLDLSKTLSGREWQNSDAFEFVLDRYDAADESWVNLGSAKIVGASVEKIVSLNELLEDEIFETIGTYRYRITEIGGNEKEMTYDLEPRYLTVVVTDDDMDGSLEIDHINVSRGALVDYDEELGVYFVNVAFTNIYNKPELNVEDHFGYIIGYPVDYRTNAPTEDKSLWPVRPEGDITRAEVATIFFRMLTDESRNRFWSQTNPYSDVDPSIWYNNAISTLTNAGILNGYPDGTFDPNGKITRAELAAIAARFFEVKEYDGKDFFPDIAGHWAQEDINRAAQYGLVFGYPDGTFGPDKNITRAETVAVVNRTLGRAPHKDYLHKNMLVWPDNKDTSIWYYADMQEATNSHTYEMVGNGASAHEVWVEILPIRDWAKLEKEWSDANSAGNDGEVVSSEEESEN